MAISETAIRLTEEFYSWEMRGRGWDLWPYPVPLEPPFRPFLFHGASGLPTTPFDDGRKHTILSDIVERFLRRSRAPAEALPLAEADEPIAEEQIPAGDLTDLALLLPPDADVTPAANERLLVSLSALRCPLSFEVVGSSGQIVIQVAVRDHDAPLLTDLLLGFAPEAGLVPSPLPLSECWQRSEGRHSLSVDFGLSNEFMLPLATLTSRDPDPLIPVVASLEGLLDHETGVFQVVLVPVRHPWAMSVRRAVSDGQGGAFFADAPELLAGAREKTKTPLFAVALRVAARAATEGRAWEIVRSLAGGFSQLAEPNGNELIPLDPGWLAPALSQQALLDRTTYRGGMILSLSELVSLVHLPGKSLRSERLLRGRARTKQVPVSATGGDFVLGDNTHRGKTQQVTLSDSERVRHAYVIGASGTGKSTLLLSMIFQDLAAGRGFAVFDPHGDLVDAVLSRVSTERVDDVVLFDPSDEEYPVSFNILEARSELERTLLSSDLAELFRRVATSWGDQMTAVLANAILAILSHPEGGSLLELRRLLSETDFRKTYLAGVEDPEVVRFWDHEFPLLSGRPQVSILTRLNAFLRPSVMRRIVGHRHGTIDVGAIMEDGQILLAKLSSGLIGEENAHLLGGLLVSKIHQVAIARQALSPEERRDFFCYIDEFQRFVTPSMVSILEGARKYHVGLVLAHQNLRQLGVAGELGASALANAHTRICFRLGDDDARRLADGFSSFSALDLQDLPTGQAVARIGEARQDFNLATRDVPAVHDSERARFPRDASRAKYAILDGEDPGRLPEEIEHPHEERAVLEAPPAPPREVARPSPRLSPPDLPGRGGAQHKYLQQLVKRLAEERGLRATIEHEVPDGGRVDVALESDDLRIACEISISSRTDQELANIQKCLAAGFDRVVVLAIDRKRLRTLSTTASEALEARSLERVTFLHPDQLVDHLDRAIGEGGPAETTVRGYRVRVSQQQAPDAHERRRAVARVIADSLKRLRDPHERS